MTMLEWLVMIKMGVLYIGFCVVTVIRQIMYKWSRNTPVRPHWIGILHWRSLQSIVMFKQTQSGADSIDHGAVFVDEVAFGTL